MDQRAQKALIAGLDELGLASYQDDIAQYIRLLLRWNRAYNLVATTDELTLINRHIFDCLAARPFIAEGPCLDVGTGAGLPGLILAVTMPSTEWVLLDANGKKTRFCQQAVRALGLDNVHVVQQRLQHHHPEHCYMTIISRAYSQAAGFVLSSAHLMCDGGRILAMKGRIAREEKADALTAGLHVEIEPMHAPGQTGERHMMIFKKKAWQEP